jgi:hypothetical protein
MARARRHDRHPRTRARGEHVLPGASMQEVKSPCGVRARLPGMGSSPPRTRSCMLVRRLRVAVVFVHLTPVTGIAYPAAVTAASRILFPTQASGGLVHAGDDTVGGSTLEGRSVVGERFVARGGTTSRSSQARELRRTSRGRAPVEARPRAGLTRETPSPIT